MYKLNDIPLSTYGITPGRMDGEHLAVKGIFDMPKRIGDTHYGWAESNGVEPFVDADEIFLDGRTIYFQGILIGDVATLKSFLNAFKTAIDAFNDVVPFETPYGTFCVLVSKVTPKFYHGGALVLIEFNEPQVGASCSIGTAPTVYYSAEYSENATKNNCANGYYGSTVTLTAAAGKFTSTVSQAAADLLAVQWVRDYKQDYANANGTCTINPTVYYNVKLTGTLQKDDCESGYVGGDVTYTVPAFKYSSLISQEDADDQAQAELDATLTQTYANENGTCILYYYNNALDFTRQKNSCPSGYTGEVLKLHVPANTFSSTTSQAHADSQALSYAEMELSQAVANATGSCISNAGLSLVKIEYFTQIQTLGIKKFFLLTAPINVGDTYTLLAYGVKASYTVISGDTVDDVITKWVNVIRSKTVADWNAENMYPNSSNEVYLPKANAKTDIDWIEIKMAKSTTFQVFIE